MPMGRLARSLRHDACQGPTSRLMCVFHTGSCAHLGCCGLDSGLDVPVRVAHSQEQQPGTTKTARTKHDDTRAMTEKQKPIFEWTPAACIGEEAPFWAIPLAPCIFDHPKFVWVIMQDAAAGKLSTRHLEQGAASPPLTVMSICLCLPVIRSISQNIVRIQQCDALRGYQPGLVPIYRT